MFHPPYIAELLAAERQRDFLKSARSFRASASLRAPGRWRRLRPIGGYEHAPYVRRRWVARLSSSAVRALFSR